MARGIEKLSAVKVAKLKQPGCYGDGGNLWLQIGPNGGKSWLFRYSLHGKAKNMGLGPLHTVSLTEAREKATAARKLLLDGLDPGTEKQERLNALKMAAAIRVTFDHCAEKYIEAHRAGWKNPKHADQWENTIATYASPHIGAMPVANIDTPHILKVLEPIWSEKTETASRLRGRLEKILDWAKVRGYRSSDNPAKWGGHLAMMLPNIPKASRTEHHPALPYQQVGAFMAALRLQEGMGARALEFAILTAARSGEVRGAVWQEIDLNEKHWTIPKGRMKMKREHRIPLTDAAVKLLKALPRFKDCDLVFPAPRKGQLSDMTLTAVIRRMQGDDAPVWTDTAGQPITAHGFRSTFRDWAGETTAHPREVIEHALAHQLKDKAEAAYQRGTLFDKRRRLMADWSKFCTLKQPTADNVVGIRGAA